MILFSNDDGHKQAATVHAQHSRLNSFFFLFKKRYYENFLGKTVAATFAASGETNLHIASDGEVTFTKRFQSLSQLI
jgi:hypothetical protein